MQPPLSGSRNIAGKKPVRRRYREGMSVDGVVSQKILSSKTFDSRYQLSTVIPAGGKIMQTDFNWESIGPLHPVDDITVYRH
jgi:hypothetical protein